MVGRAAGHLFLLGLRLVALPAEVLEVLGLVGPAFVQRLLMIEVRALVQLRATSGAGVALPLPDGLLHVWAGFLALRHQELLQHPVHQRSHGFALVLHLQAGELVELLAERVQLAVLLRQDFDLDGLLLADFCSSRHGLLSSPQRFAALVLPLLQVDVQARGHGRALAEALAELELLLLTVCHDRVQGVVLRAVHVEDASGTLIQRLLEGLLAVRTHLLVVQALVFVPGHGEPYSWVNGRRQGLHLGDADFDVVAFSSAAVVEEAVIRPDVEAEAGAVPSRLPALRIAALDQAVGVKDVHRDLLLLADLLHDLRGDAHVPPLAVLVGVPADQRLLGVDLLLLLGGLLQRVELLKALLDFRGHLFQRVLWSHLRAIWIIALEHSLMS